jgi:hypothetical protein
MRNAAGADRGSFRMLHATARGCMLAGGQDLLWRISGTSQVVQPFIVYRDYKLPFRS